MPFLELCNIEKTYGHQSSVGPISFSVERGEFISLLGPSGCGKTTMLRCIAGFLQPTAGDIRVDNRSIVNVSPHRRDIGLVFQNYALFPHLNVFENIAFGLRLRKRPRGEVAQRVAQSLDLVDLKGLAERFPSQLSGGQQQRVALARCLVLEPRLLLLDEPLSNLDAKLRIQMRAELRKLQSKLGITTIYVTHEQSEALALSDRVVVMNAGVVCQISTPRELYERPWTAFVADFIGASNLIAGTIQPAAEGPGSTIVSADGSLTLRSLETVPVERASAGVYALVRPERIRLGRPDGRDASREDAFLNTFSAVVTDVTYLGEGLQVGLVAAGGIALTANVAATRDGEPRAGTRVDAFVLAHDVHLVPFESTLHAA